MELNLTENERQLLILGCALGLRKTALGVRLTATPEEIKAVEMWTETILKRHDPTCEPRLDKNAATGYLSLLERLIEG